MTSRNRAVLNIGSGAAHWGGIMITNGLTVSSANLGVVTQATNDAVLKIADFGRLFGISRIGGIQSN